MKSGVCRATQRNGYLFGRMTKMSNAIQVWDRFLLVAIVLTIWGGIAWSFYGTPTSNEGIVTDTGLPNSLFASALACVLIAGAVYLVILTPIMLLSWIIFNNPDPQWFFDFLMRVYPL
jgi:hypothetical protein